MMHFTNKKEERGTQMDHERSDEKTPSGGDYSIIWYLNDNWEPVDKAEATKAEICEYMSDGTMIMSTIGYFEKK